MPAVPPPLTPAVRTLVDLAIEEDLGRGDATTAAIPLPADPTRALVRAREPLVACGLPVAELVLARGAPDVVLTRLVAEGEAVAPGEAIAALDGPPGEILRIERTLLNFLQRLSGVATVTRRYADTLDGTGARVADTRKTLPGWRALDKYAVRVGGGANHRADLASGVMVKDNHIAAAGSIGAAVRAARAGAPHGLRVEVEVDRIDQVGEALAAGAEVLLLDNMDPDQVREAVDLVAGRALVEVSGGVTLERLRAYAEAGAAIISVGALTHSARAVDLGLDMDPPGAGEAGLDPNAAGVRAAGGRPGGEDPGGHRGEAGDLAPERVAPLLRTRWLGRRHVHRAVLDSTSEEAARLAAAGAPHGTLVTAGRQTAGRGRRGHTWHSPAGAGLYLSVLLRPTWPLSAIPPLSLVAGLAAARAVEATAGARPTLKWPNDLLLGGRKVGGILVELHGEGGRLRDAVIGIGLNVAQRSFPPELAGGATSLALETGRAIGRGELLAAVARELEGALDVLDLEGSAPLMEAWRDYAPWLGGRVAVREGEAEITGVATGLDPRGRLRIRTGDGETRLLLSGEVLLLQDG